MSNTFNRKRNDGLVRVPVASATVVEVGDLIYWDASANEGKPFSSQTDNTSEERNQAEAARNFLGVSLVASADGETTDLIVDVSPQSEFEFTVPSGTFDVGDLLGASENTGGTALEDQQLETVGSQDLAIFAVSKAETSATTTVRCRMIRSVAWAQDKVMPRLQSNAQTLSADLVLTHDSKQLQLLDPGGAGRNVDLPAEEESAGLFFVIANRADALEILTIRDDAGATICTPTQNETAIVFCDGTNWVGLVGDAV